jgi:hypothetical protein
MRFFIMLFSTFVMSACAEQSAMRLSQDMVRINVSTAPIYGALEAQKRAYRLAADETVKLGYDKFLIVDGSDTFKQNVLGQSAGYYQSTGQATIVGGVGQATSQATYVGPQTIAMPRYESAILVKMFRNGDPASENAIDARQIVAQKG